MQAILQIQGLNKSYNKNRQTVKAVKDVYLDIYPGEFWGLVGESGCGKSTLARLAIGIEPHDKGTVLINGARLDKDVYKHMQLVFQMPQQSFNPRLTFAESIAEGLHNKGLSGKTAYIKTLEYLHLCGLTEEFAKRYPHQVSGGECQRAAIARALVLEPQLIICDEPTSALDVSSQAQIIELLSKLQKMNKLACLFITHDIALAQQVCEKIAVMNAGEIVESGLSTEVINQPRHEYTKELLAVATSIYGF